MTRKWFGSGFPLKPALAQAGAGMSGICCTLIPPLTDSLFKQLAFALARYGGLKPADLAPPKPTGRRKAPPDDRLRRFGFAKARARAASVGWVAGMSGKRDWPRLAVRRTASTPIAGIHVLLQTAQDGDGVGSRVNPTCASNTCCKPGKPDLRIKYLLQVG